MKRRILNQAQLLKAASASVLALAIAGCASNGNDAGIDSASASSETSASIAKLEAQARARASELDARERQLAQREASLASSSSSSMGGGEPLLPPNAKAGECYARVWVEPVYTTETAQMLVEDGSQKIKLIPAKYQSVEKQVMVSPASTKLEPIPAVFGTETETVLVSPERTEWLTSLSGGAPAGDKLLAAAQSAGINLDNAKPGMCYHEHYTPPEYKMVSEQVLASEASSRIETTAPTYEWVEERVLVAEASYTIEEVPAVFETQTETVLDKPAHTVWKKGTGPIQRIDEATGEIMCLVEVPATYKTITKRVLKQPATTRRVEIPAKYETVKVRKLLADAQRREIDIPAAYKTVQRKELVKDAGFVWHEVHNNTMTKETRTGAQICLSQTPAQYSKVTRKVVKQPATVKEIVIPAKYETVKVRQMVEPAREERIEIPAKYKSVTSQKLVKDGHMEWRSILCETNMTRDRITSVQRALDKAGYDPGAIDGIIGKQTVQAVNAFQRAKNLPVDKYLNIQTLQALGVSPK
ncbi:MAG: peptidoglycan-binding domain-containing protein [Pseudomonadales bacterium]